MNWVDVLIFLLIITAVVRGFQAGFLQLVLASVGSVGGLLLGSWLATKLAVHLASPFSKLLIIVLIEFGLALLLGAVGDLAGLRLKAHAVRLHLGGANDILGAVFQIAVTLLVIWLVASALVEVRSVGIGRSIQRSFIIRRLDDVLPPAPDILTRLENIIDPNGFPNVFIGLEPQHTTISPRNSVNNQAILKDEKSVVKIQGTGCGGIVFGSGFVVAKNIVVTDAHVVAGIAKPQVVDRFTTYKATVIWFDPDLDIAVLRVNNLNITDTPLTLNSQVRPDADAAAILGFPGGGPLVASTGAIIDHVTAVGRNIYGQGSTSRNIYEVQASVEEGDSGGPLLAPDGSVAGVVFAKSVTQGNIGYALLVNQVQPLIKPLIKQAERQNAAVSTGSCAQ